VIGAVLDVINTWHGLNQRRVKLKVVPKTAYPVSHAEESGLEMEALPHPLYHRHQSFDIGGVAWPHLATNGVTLHVGFVIDSG